MTRPVALLFATSGHSGVDRVISNLLPEFGKLHGQAFHLLTIRGHGPSVPESLPENIRVIRLPAGSKRTTVIPLIGYLLRHRPAALMTANHMLNRAALLARLVTRCDTRVVIRMGMSVRAQIAELPARRAEALRRSMRRWYYRADAIITPSLGVAEDLVSIAAVERGRVHVIRNPIVNENFFALAQAPLEHSWYGRPDQPLILAVGSLEPRKDFATLLRAFALVRRQIPARLIILGEGKEREALTSLAASLGVSEAVSLPGFEKNPYRHMRRADLFVLSSKREGASAVIIEAMACGTPVVSTDCPSGPAEALQRGRLGRLVPVGDASALASAMVATLRAAPAPQALRAATSEHRAELAAARYLDAMAVAHGF